ncbi:MAG: Mannose-phosphate guanylyltransferase [Peptococcaceae bacterium]|jgi:mannose-1-phosphate guanylyltransferase|nr:Mannose-phosphate guanylyltransferase [Peptococcaceae bacterium]
MRRIALVLAGGKGNRFWPKSSPDVPKQFLKITGNSTLLQDTVRRIEKVVPREDIFIITGVMYGTLVKEQVPQIPAKNLILEPMGRDTAPALGYALEWLSEIYADAILITLPADHYVAAEEKWKQALLDACTAAGKDSPVVIGITPTRPETGYGYIITREQTTDDSQTPLTVKNFVEKPDILTAVKLLAEGNCFWNSGMFIWKLSVVRTKLKQYLPSVVEQLEKITTQMKKTGILPCQDDIPASFYKAFSHIPAISIDYGLMEKCDDILLIPGTFIWDDVGGWQALERLYESDAKGNINLGRAVLHDTENCIVEWQEGPALLVGLKEMVVAGREGKLLVCPKSYLPQLKTLLTGIAGDREKPKNEGEECKIVPKPWGKEIWWALTERYAAKILEIESGHSTSLHVHERKHETFYIDKGQGTMVLENTVEELFPGKIIVVKPGRKHRIMAQTDMRLFEVSTPEMEDVRRVEDHYGRSGDQ